VHYAVVSQRFYAASAREISGERLTGSMFRSRVTLSALVVVVSVVVVHGVNLSKPLFSDDYFWFGIPDHAGWVGSSLLPGRGLYRPLVVLWFAGTRVIFGFSPLAYHAFALAFLIAAAVMVRTLGVRIGMGDVAATTAGVVYGTYGALTLTTIWASSAGGEFAVACSLAAIVLIFDRVTRWRVVVSAVLFVLALLAREASVVMPALMMIVLVTPRRDSGFRWHDVRTAARKAAGLWVVAALYVVVRVASGLPPANNPYATRLFGTHLLRNAEPLLQDTARFGAPVASPAAAVWDVVFWATVIVASVLAFKRRRYLPVAGLVWFAVGCLPVLTLINHPMEAYYLDFALVGLAITLASLLDCFVRSRRATVAVVVCFVATQVVAVQRFDDLSATNVAIRRSEAMREMARSLPRHGPTLIVPTHCPRDADISKDGKLFQVVRAQPDLKVRFDVLRPHRC
jgi:hypothetical protein